MCFNHENGKVKYTFKNEWDEWKQHLNHVATQGFGFCQVCDYCSKNTYASVAAHTEDGTRQVQVGGNTTHPIMAERPWKKNWNGTRLDFANEVTPASSFGVAFNWLLKGTNGNYLNDFEGCDGKPI